MFYPKPINVVKCSSCDEIFEDIEQFNKHREAQINHYEYFMTVHGLSELSKAQSMIGVEVEIEYGRRYPEKNDKVYPFRIKRKLISAEVEKKCYEFALVFTYDKELPHSHYNDDYGSEFTPTNKSRYLICADEDGVSRKGFTSKDSSGVEDREETLKWIKENRCDEK